MNNGIACQIILLVISRMVNILEIYLPQQQTIAPVIIAPVIIAPVIIAPETIVQVIVVLVITAPETIALVITALETIALAIVVHLGLVAAR